MVIGKDYCPLVWRNDYAQPPFVHEGLLKPSFDSTPLLTQAHSKRCHGRGSFLPIRRMHINGSTEDQCWIIHRACRPSKSKGSRHCVDLRSRSHRSYTTSNHSTRTGTSNILYLPINNLTNKNRCVSNIIKEHILLIGLIGPRQEYRYFPGSNI